MFSFLSKTNKIFISLIYLGYIYFLVKQKIYLFIYQFN